MKNLFTLLITNKQHNNKLNSVLQESLKHYNKINFLKNIKNNYKFNSKENMIVKNKKKYQIHKLYSQLSSAYKYNKEMQEKVIFCSKKYFIINMQKSMIKTYIHNDDLQCKSVQLQNKIGEIQKIRFFKQLNIKYKYHHK